MTGAQEDSQPIHAQLGLWDTVSIMIGIVIGATIYEMPPLIFSNVSNAWIGLGAWVLGGVLSLIGALCYAELASTYPRMGGDYVYLSRAFGAWLGFLFGWAQLAVILTSSIGAMAYVFANYALKITGCRPHYAVFFAGGAVVVLSLLNMLGLMFGKRTQNLLTAVKILGLGAIVSAGLFWAQPSEWEPKKPMGGPGFGLAMIFILYAYGGWNDAAFVAAEIKDRKKNIPLALLIGTGVITIIYVLVNLSYILVLGFEGVRESGAVAADVLAKPLGDYGKKAISVLVMISALGAVNGLILTGSRVYAKLGEEHSIFALLGRWDPQLGASRWSLLVQMLISVAMIGVVGTKEGQAALDSALQAVSLPPLPWEKYHGGFATLVAGTAPVFWLFFLLTGIALFVLRFRDRGIERSFTVPLFPVLPLIFCGMCVYMLYSALDYAQTLALLGVVPLLCGLPLYLISKHRSVAEVPASSEGKA